MCTITSQDAPDWLQMGLQEIHAFLLPQLYTSRNIFQFLLVKGPRRPELELLQNDTNTASADND